MGWGRFWLVCFDRASRREAETAIVCCFRTIAALTASIPALVYKNLAAYYRRRFRQAIYRAHPLLRALLLEPECLLLLRLDQVLERFVARASKSRHSNLCDVRWIARVGR